MMKRFKGKTRLKKQLLFFGYKGYVSVYSKKKSRIKVNPRSEEFKINHYYGFCIIN